jgi:hypothetical protein
MNSKLHACFLSAAAAMACLIASVPSVAQSVLNESSPNQTWIGVWQGEFHGSPSVILTLADDSGQLGGTLVLNIIKRDEGQGRIVARETHLLANPSIQGTVLSFRARKLDGGLFNFTVALNGLGTGTIHCTNCGADAPTVAITRE